MKFETLQQVREWRSHEKIECLICHKKLDRINHKHVAWHGLTQDEYRALFGIPWGYSLTGTKTREVTARSNKNTPFLVPRKKGDPPGRRSLKPVPPAVTHYWRNYIVPQGPKNTVRGTNGRFIEKEAGEKEAA